MSKSRKMITLILGVMAFAWASTAVPAIEVNFTYSDGPGEGFNDPTLGAKRRAAWEYAVNMWASRLEGTRPLRVSAAFNNLGTGDYAVLGKAGANYIYRDFPGAAKKSTWYGDPLADQMANTDLSPGEPDIIAQFNDQVDTLNAIGAWSFYYGTDENVPPYHLSFVRLALHELAHGLGFSPAMKSRDGSMPDNVPGAYDRLLVLDEVNQTPLINMTQSQRFNAMQSNNVFLTGEKIREAYGKPAPVYAPNPVLSGSSISHLDYLAYAPGELMEPVLMGTSFHIGLTDDVLAEIGWKLTPLPLVGFIGRRLTGDEDYVAMGSTMSVAVELSSASQTDTAVYFEGVDAGSAQAGLHYLVETPSPLVIPAGQVLGSIRLRALATSDAAGREITLRINSAVGAEPGDTLTKTITIQGQPSAVTNWAAYE